MSGLNLRASVSLDGSGMAAGLAKLEETGKHAFGELKNFALQAFGAYGAERMFHKSIEDAKELVNAAKRLGTDGVEGLQVLRQAADGSCCLPKPVGCCGIARSQFLQCSNGFEWSRPNGDTVYEIGTETFAERLEADGRS